MLAVLEIPATLCGAFGGEVGQVARTMDGNDALLEQDIAVIQRNVDAVGRTLSGKGEAAYDGIQKGLADCDY
jgi:hypothetical protein